MKILESYDIEALQHVINEWLKDMADYSILSITLTPGDRYYATILYSMEEG